MRRHLENLIPALLVTLVLAGLMAFALPAIPANAALASTPSRNGCATRPADAVKYYDPSTMATGPQLLQEALDPATRRGTASNTRDARTAGAAQMERRPRVEADPMQPPAGAATAAARMASSTGGTGMEEPSPYQPDLRLDVSIDFDPRDGFSPDWETWHAGSRATWRVEVVNEGLGTARDVRVTDSQGIDLPAFDLAPGLSNTIEYSTRVDEQTCNVVTARCDDSPGPAIDHASALVPEASGLRIRKYVDFDPRDGWSDDTENWYRYETARWKIVVTNDGVGDLQNVRVTDTNGHDFGEPFMLFGGETRTFEYEGPAVDDSRNTARVEAVDELGSPVPPAYDDAAITVYDRPAMLVTTTAVPRTDGSALFRIVVENGGNTALWGVKPTDNTGRHSFPAPFRLDPGQQRIFICQVRPTVDTTLSAAITATDELGQGLSRSDMVAIKAVPSGVSRRIAFESGMESSTELVSTEPPRSYR